MKPDNRNTKRFFKEFDGSLYFKDKKDPDTIQSALFKTKDISLHGVRITTHQFLPVNSNIKLSLNLAEPALVLTVTARIVWIKRIEEESGYEMGIEFYHDMKTIENLQHYLYRI